MKRCVILSGAPIGNYDRIKQEISKDDYIVCCDSGLNHIEALQMIPRLVVGDFDSHSKPDIAGVEIIELPKEKDDTDTVYAVKEMIKRGYDDFVILGAVGARLDHTLGNVSILFYLDGKGKKACIIDDYSEMTVVSDSVAYVEDKYSYFSLINITGKAEGITIKNAKYPLNDAKITVDYQYGISNEVIKGKTAQISVREGRLLLIKVTE